MNITNKDLSEKNFVTLTVSVGAEEFEEAVERAYRKNVSKLNVPGFRKGKVPRRIAERMYGEGVFYEDAVNIAYPKAISAAIEESGVEPVDQADVNITEISSQGFTFEAKLPLMPEITLGQYKGLEADMPDAAVDESSVDDEIERLRKRNSRQETVEREARDGDAIRLDFEGFVDGVPFEGGKAEGQMLTLGSGSFIPGFEEQLVGIRAGESREINVSFPEEYHAEELAGKAAVFKCVVHEVKEIIKPEPDDEFAKDVSEYDTIAEFRASIREGLEENKKREADRAFEDGLFDKLLAGVEVELHDCMIDRQVDGMMQDFAFSLSRQRINLESYMSITGMSADQMRDDFRPNAERRVKLSMAFDKIAELEAFEVSEEELDAEYDKLAEAYKMKKEKVREAIPEDSVKKDLLNVKAVNLVKDSAIRKGE